ncbi:hypothetical protein X474_15145 [Dethiosulfatarculus sandiegensis]|uniref:Uncharacterized protein n=1 Tax=Dethiosulfatarculus sandiegensis TaxID=1429043 RepID=A0A0D2JBZ9_9BACT|nr:hypothetical protein X474_15145 [Dethiosulfatarculus sandiegensis]
MPVPGENDFPGTGKKQTGFKKVLDNLRRKMVGACAKGSLICMYRLLFLDSIGGLCYFRRKLPADNHGPVVSAITRPVPIWA